MTPEREAQMREMFRKFAEDKANRRAIEGLAYRQDVALFVWRACARALEPVVPAARNSRDSYSEGWNACRAAMLTRTSATTAGAETGVNSTQSQAGQGSTLVPNSAATACVACEGSPSAENNPCAVCGSAATTSSDANARIEELRKGLFEARDAMSVMANWVKKSDPAGQSWALHMVDRANATLSGSSAATVDGASEYVKAFDAGRKSVLMWIDPSVKAEIEAAQQQANQGASHEWDATGERCLKCGDKDWFAGRTCSGKAAEQQAEPGADGLVPLPVKMPASIYGHATLGDLYDRLAVQQYAVGYALACLSAQSGQRAGVAETAAARDVLAERARQISAEGWTPAHDDKHDSGEIAVAASIYAWQGNADYPKDTYPSDGHPPPGWPWSPEWWKPRSQRRNLVKAGALILAEIERLDRAAAPTQQQEGESYV